MNVFSSRVVSYRQSGEINVLAIPLALMAMFFIAAAAFGYWAYTERTDYKENSDQKSAIAAEAARKDEGIIKDKAYAEAEKQPLTAYDGPSQYGSIHADYPKSWSVYVDSSSKGDQPLDAYFNPRVVPSVSDQASIYALRIEVVEQTYASVLKSFNGSAKSKQVTVEPYSLPKVPGVVGVKVDGLVSPNKKTTGSMIIMPLRDKTIKVWTETPQTVADFNNFILPNLTFAP